MKCNYEIENVFPDVSLEEIKQSICKKIARLIMIQENLYRKNKH